MRRRNPYLAIGVVCGFYLLVTLAVTAVEYFSEMSKLSRGFYTDTFSPFAFTHLLTLPSSAVHSDWPGYPEEFEVNAWRDVVRQSLGSVLVTILMNTAVLGILLWVIARRKGRHVQS